MQLHVIAICLAVMAVSVAGTETETETETEQRVKHVVVLMLENRPFDHLFGWMEGVDGLTGEEFNLVEPNDPSSYVSVSVPVSVSMPVSVSLESLCTHEQPLTPSPPHSQKVFVDSKAPELNQCDPCHRTPCTFSLSLSLSLPLPLPPSPSP